MNKQIIKTLEINVSDMKSRIIKQENYLNNASKLSKNFTKEASALIKMKEALKLEALRLSNAECMCF